MEACRAFDEFAIVAEGDAALGNDGVELCEGIEVLVDDGLVDMDPEGLGRLQFGGIGWQVYEADSLGHREAGQAVPAGVVEK